MSDEPQNVELDGGDSRTTSIIFGSIALLAILAFGAIGHFSGSGWFGYRQWIYGEGELYLGNYGNDVRKVSIDGRETVTLKPRHFEVVDLVGGTTDVGVMDQNGELLATHRVFADKSDAFVKVSENGCLAASDISSFYLGSSASLKFVEFIRREDHVYVPESRNVVWPGKDFPSNLESGEGPGIWIEKVGCNHIKHPNAMKAYLEVRLRDRIEREGERRRRRRP